jgi:hypothetical protein
MKERDSWDPSRFKSDGKPTASLYLPSRVWFRLLIEFDAKPDQASISIKYLDKKGHQVPGRCVAHFGSIT